MVSVAAGALAKASIAMNWACMSVGKAGKGAVDRQRLDPRGFDGDAGAGEIEVGAGVRPERMACIKSSRAPASSSDPPVIGGAGIGTGFDPVGHHRIGGAVEPVL